MWGLNRPETAQPRPGKHSRASPAQPRPLVAYLNRAPAGVEKVGKVNVLMENAGSYQAEKLPEGRWQGGPL